MTKGTAWFDKEGNPHKSLEECQKAELEHLLSGFATNGAVGASVEDIAALLVDHADQFANILTMKDDSRPRARGQKRPRTKPDPAKEAA